MENKTEGTLTYLYGGKIFLSYETHYLWYSISKCEKYSIVLNFLNIPSKIFAVKIKLITNYTSIY